MLFNDPSFDAQHATPVLYVHGINSHTIAFRRNARLISSHGHWVWGYDYGRMLIPGLAGTGRIEDMVDELGENVDHVLSETGASKVNVVAHSQGGLLTKLFIAAGGAERVERVVAMGANFHGTDLRGYAARINPITGRNPKFWERMASPSAVQQLAGSEWSHELATVPDTDPRVMYTSLYSRRDHVVTPVETSILTPIDGADVVNLEIPGAPLHPLMPRDRETAELTLWGLEREPGETAPS